MEMNDRVIYSQDEMLLALEDALERLNRFRYDGKYKTALGETFIDEIEKWEREIRRRKDDPFTLVVIGNFKRGKSSFINALLGEDVAPIDVTTETVTLNRIQYGTHSNRAVLADKKQLSLDDRELKRSELQNVLSGLDQRVSRLEINRPNDFLKKVTIIDTPGTEDALEDFQDIVAESLLRADAVIYVYNVSYPLSHTEQLFLRTAVLPQQFTSLLLVGNFADSLETLENYANVKKMLESRISVLLPDTDVIMVSALDERCRQLGAARLCPALAPLLEKEFDQLRSRLDSLIAEKTNTVLIDRMQRLTSAMLTSLENSLSAQEKGLSMRKEDAEAEIDALRKAKESTAEDQQKLIDGIDEKIKQMKLEAQQWMMGFTDRIVEESKGLEKYDVNSLVKYYECYCIDLLSEAVDVCVDIHREELFEMLDEIAQTIGRKFAADTAQKKKYSFRMSVDNRIWTKADSAGLVVSRLTGFVPIMGFSLAISGVMGTARNMLKKKETPNIAGQITAQLSSLRISVNDAVIRVYDEMAERAKKLMTEYFQEKMEEEDKLTKQTLAAFSKNQEDKAIVKESIAEVRDALGKIKASILPN